MSAHILVIEDEADLAELVAFNLRRAGYSAATATSAGEGLARLLQQRPDLIVLDLMLPDVSGVEVCRRLRGDPGTRAIPVIMLTARSQEADRVAGFEAGADDYVPKPFSPKELVLRVGAVLRRSQPAPESLGRVEIGQLVVDPDRHEVLVSGRPAQLTALEFKLLLDLVGRRGRVQSRDALLERVWGYVPGVETRTVDTHIRRLRDKLGEGARYVETVRGVGYRVRGEE